MMIYTLDLNSKATKIERYWEMVVGSCHAYTALREDYRKQLTMVRKDLGFKYVRFHGLFNEQMSVLKNTIFTDDYKTSFTNIFEIFDFLLSIGMKPFIEIGFMPEALASGPETIFFYKGNVTPPKDYQIWNNFIKEFVLALINRYGRAEVRTWFFEIWNEPNLGGREYFDSGFFTGTQADYFYLYEQTVRSIKAVDKSLKVGGPATSNNAWIKEFISYCRENDVPVDFITTHHYPTDIILGYGTENSVNFFKGFKEQNYDLSKEEDYNKFALEYLTFQKDIWKKVPRGVLTEMTKRANEEAEGLPLYYTEWSSLAGLESDGPFGASFIAKTVMDNMGLVKGYGYWTFTDIFEERPLASQAFHGGFGLLTLQGIPKAGYRVYELLHSLSSEMYDYKYNNDTLDIYAFKNNEKNMVQLLLVNHQSLLQEIQDKEVTIKIPNINPKTTVVEEKRVDKDHGNALEKWLKMGSPEYLTKKQKLALLEASEVEPKILKLEDEEHFELKVKVLKQGTVLLNIYLDV